MFDPVKNAKVLGVVYLALGLIGILFNVFFLGLSQLSLASVISFLSTIMMMVVAFGLFKTKAWAVYTIGVLAFLSIIGLVYVYITTQNIGSRDIFNVGINVGIFIWFYSAINRFNK
ncbi:MAG: hypothetical protein G01um10147_565 [Microgenomates group bacterium Gr01-1014_7]|nr:MAG: hypothetical protein G01um10147_565 [Microgenomates group bacterium Gr01-1014_7]